MVKEHVCTTFHPRNCSYLFSHFRGPSGLSKYMKENFLDFDDSWRITSDDSIFFADLSPAEYSVVGLAAALSLAISRGMAG